MACVAVGVASEGHAGTISPIFLPGGEPAFMQVGKDLSEVRIVIGTKGVF